MNVYVDKDQAAELGDKYVQTSDQETEDSEEEEYQQDDDTSASDQQQFDPKTEVQLDNQVYQYTGGEDFDPKSEVKLEQLYAGADLDSLNATQAQELLEKLTGADPSAVVAQVKKNTTES